MEGVVIAVDALRANKVRAALTILGIAIGVFVVVLMSAVIHGVNSAVAEEFEKAGPTTFFVYRFPIALEGCSDADEDLPLESMQSCPPKMFGRQETPQAMPRSARARRRANTVEMIAGRTARFIADSSCGSSHRIRAGESDRERQ